MLLEINSQHETWSFEFSNVLNKFTLTNVFNTSSGKYKTMAKFRIQNVLFTFTEFTFHFVDVGRFEEYGQFWNAEHTFVGIVYYPIQSIVATESLDE